PSWRRQVVISGIGAFVTGIVMVVFVVTKFSEGAWFVVLLIPTMVFVFFRIHRHYQDVAEWLRINGAKPKRHIGPVLSILLVDNVHLGTLAMVDYAKSAGGPWKAIHIEINPEITEKVRQKWAQYVGEGELTIVPSPFRSLVQPLHDVLQTELTM